MAGLNEHKKAQAMARATAFYRRNPQATMKEVALAADCSTRTAWQARQQMVVEGVCKPNRRGGKSLAAPEPAPEPEAPESKLLDGEQMMALAEGDTTDTEDADPETRRKMLRELRSIAFGAGHPDTRVTAMKAWFTLKDIAAAKDLGPGIPKTQEAAILRLSDMNTACGSEIAMRAIIKAFSLSSLLVFIQALFNKENPRVQTADQSTQSSNPTPSDVESSRHEDHQA